VLSRFNPINALKNKLAVKSTKGISLRRGLVVFQFIIAQALIIATLIIIKQMSFFTNQSLGFNKESIINVPFPSDSVGISKLDYVKKELTAINGIQHISFSSNTPVEDNNDNWNTFNFDHSPKETDFYAITKWSDHEYVPTYQLSLIAGKNLEPSDTANGFLVNESLIKKLGINNPEDALNKEISMWGGQLKANIIGVLKDFHDRSFRAPFAPLIVACFKNGYSQAGIKLVTKDASTVLKAIENIWSKSFPDFVFEYQFLDEKVDSFYKEERRLSHLYKIFAVIAIFLSCLGLYGLASFMALQRIKEVGIRKVLGASVSSVVYLFSKEFIILVGIAFIIASPIAWYFMHKWLQDYVYRINMSWWIFMVGGISAIIIALLTVSFQAIKAAIANPAKSLRTE
jgi:ABC-type antimicrobial peptide transport system permease subunit